jgi:hypothetical protein
VLEVTGIGRRFTGKDTEGMARYLRDLAIGGRPGSGDRDRFSWPAIARELDAVLQGALGHSAVSDERRVDAAG